MIDLIVTLPTYDQDEATKRVWSWIDENFPQTEGVCYYKHPILMTQTGATPELTLITNTHQPIIIRCLQEQLDDIQSIGEEKWTINNVEGDSPLLEMEDFMVILRSKFERDRILRKRVEPIYALALPLISRADFQDKFKTSLKEYAVIWANGDLSPIVQKLEKPLSEVEWRCMRSIVQGINPLKRVSTTVPREATTLGDAIKIIDRYIALFDDEQQKAALQIAPGPQRIRGLAGTGKTVLLAMKAANIHLRYPDKKILFTFNTQSLYNQIRSLITRFYRFNSEIDPDWDVLHVRHGWGSSHRPGVYSDICYRLGKSPYNLYQARHEDRNFPFLACCKHVINEPIQQEYDFIMVDEAQDFPSEFFQILYRLSKPPHQIYWVYDQLQSLFAEKVPSPEELFGQDSQGKPYVSLNGDPYPGGIEKDLVLHRSYRCPQDVLMLAHAIGLGLYSPDGCVQMLSSKESWEALGYQVESGLFETGKIVTIYRPPENSPNPITGLYQGKEPVICAKVFDTRIDEFDWVADSISNDIYNEQVSPENIIVICLDALRQRNYLLPLQVRLTQRNIPSTIPGVTDDSAAFAEPGYVTLTNVIRAKGNESYIVYILCFDDLYDYVEALQNRNRAFTAISRSKAWVRITGVGEGMKKAVREIEQIQRNLPRFIFPFPNLESIRNLDAETDRRRSEIRKARDSIAELMEINPKALETLAAKEPELFRKLISRVEKVKKHEDKRST